MLNGSGSGAAKQKNKAADTRTEGASRHVMSQATLRSQHNCTGNIKMAEAKRQKIGICCLWRLKSVKSFGRLLTLRRGLGGNSQLDSD